MCELIEPDSRLGSGNIWLSDWWAKWKTTRKILGDQGLLPRRTLDLSLSKCQCSQMDLRVDSVTGVSRHFWSRREKERKGKLVDMELRTMPDKAIWCSIHLHYVETRSLFLLLLNISKTQFPYYWDSDNDVESSAVETIEKVLSTKPWWHQWILHHHSYE